jgi:UDP-N-acetylmuramate--alanine ligase
VLDVYGAGERAIPGVSSERIAARLREGGHRAACHDLASAERYLAGTLAPGDLVITLGAGDVWRVAQTLVEHEGRVPGGPAPEGA